MTLYQKIEAPVNGRRLAIGDIHGCSKTLQKLVWEQLRLDTQDQLFFLGDYIDRGPNGAGVIDFILELQASGYQVYPLRGNHEQMLLRAWELHQKDRKEGISEPGNFLKAARDKSMVDSAKDCLIPRFEQWLNALPHYYESGEFYLVHAGFNFKRDDPFTHAHSMMWTMFFSEKRYIAEKANHKTIIHGHLKTPLSEIKDAIARRAKVIPLDNGCYKYEEEALGQMCALDFDNWKLYCQKNIDMVRDD